MRGKQENPPPKNKQTNQTKQKTQVHLLRFITIFLSIEAAVCSTIGLAAVGFLLASTYQFVYTRVLTFLSFYINVKKIA